MYKGTDFGRAFDLLTVAEIDFSYGVAYCPVKMGGNIMDDKEKDEINRLMDRRTVIGLLKEGFRFIEEDMPLSKMKGIKSVGGLMLHTPSHVMVYTPSIELDMENIVSSFDMDFFKIALKVKGFDTVFLPKKDFPCIITDEYGGALIIAPMVI